MGNYKIMGALVFVLLFFVSHVLCDDDDQINEYDTELLKSLNIDTNAPYSQFFTLRLKRGQKYHILESHGLHSRFNSNVRSKRNSNPTDEILIAESLPIAEKQIQDKDNFKQFQQTFPSITYSKSLEDDDSSMMNARNNEGIKARAPRVNFVTQQKKPIEVSETRDRPTITKPMEFYQNGNTFNDDPYFSSNVNRRYDNYSPRKYER